MANSDVVDASSQELDQAITEVKSSYGMWPRHISLPLSRITCKDCHGEGIIEGKPCHCVLERVATICHGRYLQLKGTGTGMLSITCHGANLPFAEYCADFEMVSKRALIHLPGWQRYFTTQCLVLGRTPPPPIGRILGEAYRQAGLYPVDGYFHSKSKSVKVRLSPYLSQFITTLRTR